MATSETAALLQDASLSFAQQRLWFLEQLNPGTPAYNVAHAIRLRGPLNRCILRRSLNAMVQRHEVLRTIFLNVAGQPIRRVAASLELPLPVVTVASLSGAAQAAEVRRQLCAMAQAPFDLTQGPLIRAVVLQVDAAEHILVLTLHHIVTDGWSQGILFRELALFYEAFRAGKPSPLPALPLQYGDFAAWQRQRLHGQRLEDQVAYWRNHLAGAPTSLEFPTDLPRSASRDFEGALEVLTLPNPLAESTRALSRQARVTPFMLFLAAFQLLLARLTGQEDIIVGCPIANRTHFELEGLIGMFANTLALRTDVSGNPRCSELLQRVRDVTLHAYKYNEVPFEKLVSELNLDRDLQHNPLFDIMLNYSERPWATPTLSGLTLTPLDIPVQASKFALTLYVTGDDDGFKLRLVYQRALFRPERMRSVLEQFRILLEQIVAAPHAPVQSYALVTPSARAILPDPSAELAVPYHAPVTECVALWAARTPAQVAVCQGRRSWTYGELLARSQAVATLLLARGLARGEVVAVYGPRSFGLIVGMLAVLVSGGVLLLLDRILPAARKRVLMREAHVTRLLCIGSPSPEDTWLSEWPWRSVHAVDASTGQSMPRQDVQPSDCLPTLAPDDAAYVFFTSGSSGVPQGVVGDHKGLSHFLAWQRTTFTIGPDDRCAQLTALSFDVILRDIFLPLSSGGTLCLPDMDDMLLPEDVLSWVERMQITVLHAVPSLAQTWLTSLPPGVSLRALRWMFCAGESLSDAFVQRWRAAFPAGGDMVNLYGPTETTLAKCFYQVPAEVLPGMQPVGRPLPQTQALVLTSADQLCGIGEPGEVVLRTPFRTRGYINATPEQQRRFIRNPHRDDAADVLYHTGDRGRYRPDGTLELLGRLDHQVKIWGVRIDPDEVAAMLGHHPSVLACVVCAQERRPDAWVLIAYVVPRSRGPELEPAIRAYLRQRLPSVMVPARVVCMEQLPRTSTGKVDRKALPVPDWTQDETIRPYAAPQSMMETVLADIWAEVLGGIRVGRHDDFFALGGHSLLATQVMARIQAALQVQVPLRRIFETPTVAELAAYVEACCGVASPPARAPCCR